MKKVTLTFPTIADMVDFELKVDTHGRIKNRSRLTIKGYFDEEAIELAQAGFKARVIEEPT